MDGNTTEEPKPKKLVLTCWEDSEPYEPGTRTLFEFEDDTGGITCRTAMSKAVDYIHDLLAAVTDYRFDLLSDLKKLADEISGQIKSETTVHLSAYALPLSVVNLLIDEYNLKLEEI